MSADGDLWVFGYGSLMWKPGFPFVERAKGVAIGYRRGFCIYSTHHRGTAERPGLVLGLDRGGTCHGVAYRVASSQRSDVLCYLRAREQINGVYREVLMPVDLDGPGGEILAVGYVVERAHPSYAGELPLPLQARMIREATGLSGPNIDYLVNTVCHLDELGLAEPRLDRVLTLAHPFFRRAVRANGAASPEARTLVALSRARKPLVRMPGPAERRRFRFRIHRGDK